MARFKTLDFKRGDTLAIDCTRTNAAGAPVDLTSCTITSQVRSGGFADDLVVTVTDATGGLFTLTRNPAATALWPVSGEESLLLCDVQFAIGDAVVSSETFAIRVLEDITQ